LFEHFLPLVTSPWILLLVVAAVTIDGFLPVLPSESLVIGLGAVAVGGGLHVTLLVLAAAIGSLAGDLMAYRLGGRAGARLRRGTTSHRGNRLHDCLERGSAALRRHGVFAVLLGRYLPGGRTATAMAAGSIGFARRRFAISSAAGSVGWAAYVTALGYVGGAAMPDRPGLAMLPGLLLGAATALIVGVVNRIRRRRADSARNGHRLMSRPDSSPYGIALTDDIELTERTAAKSPAHRLEGSYVSL
jgi:membrane-associated protein